MPPRLIARRWHTFDQMRKITFLILVLITLKSFGQQNSDYVILTFTSEDKGGRHPASTHYWIVKTDSINEVGYSMPTFPTYLNMEYSNDCLTRCCENKEIDLLTSTTNTNFDYPEKHLEQSKKLLKLVNENRRFLQKTTITWQDRKIKRIIKVYGTPINGQFCECEIYGLTLKFTDGRKKVLIPNSNYTIVNGFWNTDKGKFIKFYDFSKIKPQNTL